MADEVFRTKSPNSKNVLIHPGLTADDRPVLYMDQDHAVLDAPDGFSSISLAREDGISLSGPLSLQANPELIRVAGLWKVNPLIMSSLPSTVYTPVPWMRQSFPKTSKTITEGIANITKLIAGLGV